MVLYVLLGTASALHAPQLATRQARRRRQISWHTQHTQQQEQTWSQPVTPHTHTQGGYALRMAQLQLSDMSTVILMSEPKLT
mmetsp:Transcript_666/g.2306  ORF Transcript_666/g.2306 Transcript_666/m.2306 type:complete len:82 (+) Transcript_666:53-298(+)